MDEREADPSQNDHTSVLIDPSQMGLLFNDPWAFSLTFVTT